MFVQDPSGEAQKVEEELRQWKRVKRQERERQWASAGLAPTDPGCGEGDCGCGGGCKSTKKCGCTSATKGKAEARNASRPPRAMAAGDVWTWGDPFPRGMSECGWMMGDWAVPLLDPAPCTDVNGVLEEEGLDWYLSVGTTQTTRLPDGRFRMYFSSGALKEVAGAQTFRLKPLYDTAQREKFSLDSLGIPIQNEGVLLNWWKASGTDYVNLHFSPDFVSFLDSADGINYPMYTPRVDLAPGQSCDQPDPFAGGTVTYEDSTTGFRAGWKSTSIRCRGDSLVYHDVSVVYLAALNRYLMFAVECDGESMGLSGENLSETDDCSICVPGICLQGGTPKTRFVFFTCADPDFQSGTMGPFPACPTPPDPTAMPAQWIGVPQAFMSPDENFLLFYIGGAAYMYAGMHVARVRSLQQGIQDLEDAWSRGDDVSEMGHDSFYQYFENLGICNVACNTPSSPCQGAGGSGDCAANATPTLTDEHFVFCEDGYLHLYFTNRNPQNDSEAASGTNLPLTLVSHAVAAGPWDALSVRSLLTGRPLFGGANFSGGSGLEVGYEFTTKDMLANFTMVDCDPVDMVALLGAEQIETPFGQETLVINDPNVYQAAKGDYVMIAHSQAMGGLLRFKATSRVACRSVYQC